MTRSPGHLLNLSWSEDPLIFATREALREDAVADALAIPEPSARAAARERLKSAVEDALDINLTDILLEAWAAERELVKAGDKTLRNPGTEETVHLEGWPITSDYHPEVDVVVDGVRVAKVVFDVKVDMTIQTLAAKVSGGCLTGFSCGDCDAAASMSLRTVRISTSRTVFDPHQIVDLRHRLPLVAGAEPLLG